MSGESDLSLLSVLGKYTLCQFVGVMKYCWSDHISVWDGKKMNIRLFSLNFSSIRKFCCLVHVHVSSYLTFS